MMDDFCSQKQILNQKSMFLVLKSKVLVCNSNFQEAGAISVLSWLFREFLKLYFHVLKSLQQIFFRFEKILILPEDRIIVCDCS